MDNSVFHIHLMVHLSFSISLLLTLSLTLSHLSFSSIYLSLWPHFFPLCLHLLFCLHISSIQISLDFFHLLTPTVFFFVHDYMILYPIMDHMEMFCIKTNLTWSGATNIISCKSWHITKESKSMKQIDQFKTLAIK